MHLELHSVNAFFIVVYTSVDFICFSWWSRRISLFFLFNFWWLWVWVWGREKSLNFICFWFWDDSRFVFGFVRTGVELGCIKIYRRYCYFSCRLCKATFSVFCFNLLKTCFLRDETTTKPRDLRLPSGTFWNLNVPAI